MKNINEDSERYEEFLSLFARYHDQLLGYIYSLVHNYADSEDIFQKASMVLWRKFETLEFGDEFLPWAYKVAFFEVQNYRRSHSRDRHFFGGDLMETLAQERADKNDTVSKQMLALRECMKDLDESQRSLLQKAYVSNQSIGEAAEELGRAVQTVYNRLYRIRRLLFDCVQQKTLNEEALE